MKVDFNIWKDQMDILIINTNELKLRYDEFKDYIMSCEEFKVEDYTEEQLEYIKEKSEDLEVILDAVGR